MNTVIKISEVKTTGHFLDPSQTITYLYPRIGPSRQKTEHPHEKVASDYTKSRLKGK